MATYQSLYDAAGTLPVLDKQIAIAIAIKANIIVKLATPTNAQKAFANIALADITKYLPLMRNYILAEYNTQTLAVIQTATDLQVQTAVNSAVDTLLGV